MRFSDIPFHPSSRTLRQFAGLWIVFFGGLAAWKYFAGGGSPTVAAVFLGLALTVGPLGLAFPRAIRPIFVGWMIVAFPIGWTISTVLLVLLYYLMLTPLALLFRLFGRDALHLRPRPSAETYWIPKPQVTDPRRYFQQF